MEIFSFDNNWSLYSVIVHSSVTFCMLGWPVFSCSSSAIDIYAVGRKKHTYRNMSECHYLSTCHLKCSEKLQGGDCPHSNPDPCIEVVPRCGGPQWKGWRHFLICYRWFIGQTPWNFHFIICYLLAVWLVVEDVGAIQESCEGLEGHLVLLGRWKSCLIKGGLCWFAGALMNELYHSYSFVFYCAWNRSWPGWVIWQKPSARWRKKKFLILLESSCFSTRTSQPHPLWPHPFKGELQGRTALH